LSNSSNLSVYKLSYFGLWLLNPIIALYFGIRNHKKISVVLTLVFFCGFYGTTFHVNETVDSSKYRDKFYSMHDQELDFENFKSTLFDGETTFDLVVPLITYFVASFTRNEQILFLIFGVIFGFFYGKNLIFLLNILPNNVKKSKFLIFLIFIFMLIVPFWSGLNGIRMWTGAHVFFFGVSRLIYKNEKRFYFYVILACLFHFSYIIVTIILISYRFIALKNYVRIYFVLFLISFFTSQLNIGQIKTFVNNNTPEIFKAKSEAYTKDIYIEKVTEKINNYSWHNRIYRSVLNYSIIWLLTLVYFFRSNNNNTTINIFLNFALLLYSFANFFSILPSGGRFFAIANMFALISIIYFVSQGYLNKFANLTILPLLFWIIVNIRSGFDLISLASVISNPILTFTGVFRDIPLIDFIK
jgi:hypothetical protein